MVFELSNPDKSHRNKTTTEDGDRRHDPKLQSLWLRTQRDGRSLRGCGPIVVVATSMATVLAWWPQPPWLQPQRDGCGQASSGAWLHLQPWPSRSPHQTNKSFDTSGCVARLQSEMVATVAIVIVTADASR